MHAKKYNKRKLTSYRKVLLGLFLVLSFQAKAQVETTGSCDLAPKVFISLTKLNDFGNSETALEKWPYVLNNIDGVWMNGAGTTATSVENILKNMVPKQAIFIGSIDDHNPMQIGTSINTRYDQLQDWSPQTEILGACLVNDYDKDQPDFLPGDVTEGKSLLNPKFGNEIYATSRGTEWKDSEYSNPNNVVFDMLNESDGLMFEISGARFLYQDISIVPVSARKSQWKNFVTETRKQNKKTILLSPRNFSSDERWSTSFVDMYKWMRDNDLLPGIIVVIQYNVITDEGVTDYRDIEPDMNVEFDVNSGKYNYSYAGVLFSLLEQIHKDFGCYEDPRKYWPVWEFNENGNKEKWEIEGQGLWNVSNGKFEITPTDKSVRIAYNDIGFETLKSNILKLKIETSSDIELTIKWSNDSTVGFSEGISYHITNSNGGIQEHSILLSNSNSWKGALNDLELEFSLMSSNKFRIDRISIENEDILNHIQTLDTDALKVFPNPSNSGIFQLNKIDDWVVYSILGRKILQGKNRTIDISQFPKGIYLLKTRNGSNKILYN